MTSQSSPFHLFDEPQSGTVSQPINAHQPGRIHYHASYWPAQLYPNSSANTLPIGAEVTVVGQQGIILLVTPKGYQLPDKAEETLFAISV